MKQHADLIHNNVTVLSRTSKHFKWEEAPACCYCLSSSISKSLWADSVEARPSVSGSARAAGGQRTELAVLREGDIGHGGERGPASGCTDTGGIPGHHSSPGPGPREVGISEVQE